VQDSHLRVLFSGVESQESRLSSTVFVLEGRETPLLIILSLIFFNTYTEAASPQEALAKKEVTLCSSFKSMKDFLLSDPFSSPLLRGLTQAISFRPPSAHLESVRTRWKNPSVSSLRRSYDTLHSLPVLF